MSRRVGLICGAGAFPRKVIEAVIAAGDEPAPIAIRGAAADLAAFDPLDASIGQIGRMFAHLRARQVEVVALVGAIARPDLSTIRIDWGAVKALPSLSQALRGGDDAALRAVIGVIEREGFPVVGVHEIAPSLVAGEGLHGAIAALEAECDDVARGRACLAALGGFDVGQALVVAEGRVVAIEAAEGTDAMLERVAQLRREGRLRLPVRAGVLVKTAKPGQDLRVDMPAVGPRTIERAAQAGLAGVAVEAGRVIALDLPEMVAQADARGLFLIGVGAAG